MQSLGVTRDDYYHLVKERCYPCGRTITWDIVRYERVGNTCAACEKEIIKAVGQDKPLKDYRKMPGRVEKREPIRKVPVVQYSDEQMQEMREEAHG